eukprot:comp16741_c0_seq1/m.15053 comp16741_c0_seq1/g.15053  ORF comp16741_c0_seq1/g.15053 comp16741_c0_seq1/m.15053 type:complete len:339 (-) comp16741_c0_seq1:516-1532(-)
MLSRTLRNGGLRASFIAARAIHASAFRATAEAPFEEHEEPVRTVQDLVEEGVEVFKKSSKAYFNYSPDDLSFIVGKDYRGNPHPEFRYKKETLKFGLEHLTPWSVVYYATLGMKGNLGEKIYNSSLIREKPSEAQTQIALSITRRHAEEAYNQDFAEYRDWLNAIDEKLCSHIANNLDAYPRIKAKSGGAKSRDVLQAILLANMARAVRYKKDETGHAIEHTDYVIAKQQMFVKARQNVEHFACEWDKGIYMKENLVRRKLMITDAYSNQIPICDKPVSGGNIVSCMFVLTPNMWEHYYSMKRTVSSVSILCKAERKVNNVLQPYAGVKFAGGYSYDG